MQLYGFDKKFRRNEDNSHRFLAGVRVWTETTSVRKMFLAATAQIMGAQ